MIGRRGTIRDRSGNELAASVSCFSLYLIPREIEDINIFLEKLSTYVEFDMEKKTALLEKYRKNSFLWFKRGLSVDEYAKIRDSGLEGINFKKEYKRVYPEGSLASNLIGMVGIDKNDFFDNRGLEGLEHYLDKNLKGRKTMLDIMTDNRGYNVFSDNSETEYSEYDGSDITLTIDKVIQFWAETELRETVVRNKAQKGFIIVMDVNTFDLYAIANYPTFSPDDFSDEDKGRFKNYAFLDVYEPGSTFKLVTAAAAMDSGYFDMDSDFECEGQVVIDKGPPVKCEKAHGDMKLKDTIAFSCNVSMVNMALQMEYTDFYNMIGNLGFGQKTGVEFPYEERGLLHKPDRFVSGRDIASMGFGYGIAVTGIQMATAYSTLVNGGVRRTPRLIRNVVKNGIIERAGGVQEEQRVIEEHTSRNVNEILSAVVEYGTGQKVGLEDFKVGGKTGTAKKASSEGYFRDKYISSFIGAFPVDSPEILIYVVIDEPSEGEYYGGNVAGPAFRNIAENIIDYLKMSPETIRHETRDRNTVIVPSFTGITKERLLSRMDMLNMDYQIFGKGDIVVFQEPAPGSILEKDGEIQLYFGDSELDGGKKQLMPDFTGMTMRKAVRMIKRLNVQYKISGGGVVREQSPAPGTVLEEGSLVRLEFSN
ncbi:MAG: penicillin-binding transpeptidase domain-containing protein [Candidatus Muiribacteriaceae bacterium]